MTGRLYIRWDRGSFPDEQWSDFPAVILTWWIEGITELVTGRRTYFECLFMDGPFAFELHGSGYDSCRISWHGKDLDHPIDVVSSRTLLESAVAAGRLVVQECHARGWGDADLERLESAIARSSI